MSPGSYFLPGRSKKIDPQFHDVSYSQIRRWPHTEADPRGRAGTDNVTGQKRHELAHIADERGYVENHFGCGAFLSEFAINCQPHPQPIGLRDFVSGGQERPERSKCVCALSLHPLTAPL